MNRLVHAAVPTKVGIASLCDMLAIDAGPIADYFFRPDPHLDTLIDRSKLISVETVRDRFGAMIRSGDPGQKKTMFSICLGEHLIGFTALYRDTSDINYSHWHIIEPELRAIRLSSALYPHRIKTYFDLFPIERLIHQTKTSNVGVNKMLDKFVPIARTGYVESPDGLASPGEFNIRYVHRFDIPAILAKGACVI